MTDTMPKPMVPIGGRPALEHNVRALTKHGVRDLVVNLHHFPEVIREHFGDGSKFGVSIYYSPEPELLGTAGALRSWKAFFQDTFLVVYGDNVSTCNFTRLLEFHRSSKAYATVTLFWRDDVSQSGIAEVLPNGRITRFVEKPGPDQVFSSWVNAGILVLEPECLASIPDTGKPDFSRELLPRWLDEGRPVYGYRMSPDEHLWWIDRPEDFERVQQEMKHVSFS